MIRIYYHVFATEGVLEVLQEQIELIEKNFKVQYELNIGICKSNNEIILNDVIEYIKKKNYKIRSIEKCHSEWNTLNLIEGDRELYDDDDIIIYIHTKGITHFHNKKVYNLKVSWRQMLNYFLLERIDFILDILDNKNYNVYGVSKHQYDWDKPYWFMTANFWAVTGLYAKSVDTTAGNRKQRTDVENRFWGLGNNPLIYEAKHYNKDFDFDNTLFNRDDYEIKN